MRSSTLGLPLPSARVVSSHMLLDNNNPSATNNLMFMQFGQFIAHDTTNGVMFTIGKLLVTCKGLECYNHIHYFF